MKTCIYFSHCLTARGTCVYNGKPYTIRQEENYYYDDGSKTRIFRLENKNDRITVEEKDCTKIKKDYILELKWEN